MENLSTGQNLGQNTGRSSYSPSQYGNQMSPSLEQPDSRDEGESEGEKDGGIEDEEDAGANDSSVGQWQEKLQGARNKTQSADDSGTEDSGTENEKKTSGQDSDGENKEGISALISKGMGEAENAAREATGEALRQSWINLFTTYGLTFIYINIHFIFAYLGGPFARFFPKAGREWLSKFTKGLPVPEQLKNNIEESAGASIEPFELGLVVLVDVLIILLILAILFIGYILITESPASLLYHSVVD